MVSHSEQWGVVEGTEEVGADYFFATYVHEADRDGIKLLTKEFHSGMDNTSMPFRWHHKLSRVLQ